MRTALLSLLAAVGPSLGWAAAAESPAPPRIEYNRDVRPILSDKCFACHGPDAQHRQADLRLDKVEGATADLGGRAAIVPGKPEASALVARITSADADERMPPAESGKQLTQAQVELLRRWIAQGAEYQPHWALVPPRRPAVPAVKQSGWPRNDIDRFLLARLEKEGLAPSPQADPITLCRRLYFDLTGLPPAVAEVEEFVSAYSRIPALPHSRTAGTGVREHGGSGEDVYLALVDKLLASPHYGERMAMHWFDLVRFANTVGYHGDQEHAINPYRDWVIKAFNDNLPFDEFTTQQLAGDLLPEATDQQRIASGYNRLLQTSHEGGVQKKEYLHKYDADRVRNFSAVWLGLTMGCCECHDHKYDPLTQRDFYSLAAVFADVDDLRTFKGGDTTPTKREPEILVASPLAPGGEKQRTMVSESVTPRVIRVLHRGDWMDDSGPIAEPATPECLPAPPRRGDRLTRVELARWLMSAEHPLAARVAVNRYWHLFFGVGLCNSLEDFGAQGEWPVHPELLDWLAVEFREGGWDMKRIVRLLVTSQAYRQSSRSSPTLDGRDPDNRLLARQSAWRLPAEMIRDNALAASGLLVRKLGGASGHPYQPARYYQFLNFPKRDYQPDTDENQYRRGVYTHWQRQFLHPMLKAFDAPSREECTARRPISNTPLAALTLLNDPTFIECARVLAARALEAGGDAPTDRVRWMWRTVLSREAHDDEAAVLERLYAYNLQRYQAAAAAAEKLLAVGLAPRPSGVEPAELAAWTAVARAILNLHETIVRS